MPIICSVCYLTTSKLSGVFRALRCLDTIPQNNLMYLIIFFIIEELSLFSAIMHIMQL